MKPKSLLLIIALLGITALAWTAGIDVIVMVDTSESMFPVFDDVVNYLIRDLLENRLHTGDSSALPTLRKRRSGWISKIARILQR